ncbi:MAG: beta-N-acetylhexosaminidase [Hyphomicrobiaceae bacterium]|nr:MAG: beta-N-acetylhexosaminidase [Hyphomicrobiaceae bacterium]
MLSAFIAALAGPELSSAEAAVLRAARPCGIILFARNAVEPEQVRRLTDAVRTAIGSGEVLVLIDQEGGRVQRLRPPHWRALPPAAAYAKVYDGDPGAALRAARLSARLTAADLRALGINTNCTPVLDVPVPGSHDIIGDRAYGTAPDQVAALGRAVAEGHMAGGVLPVIKHIPGHGRATKDSHLDLPVVQAPRAELEASDFAPFRALAAMPAAMTAHVVFTAIDADRPASTSARVTGEVIRGSIGFGGLLMSDDLGMRALSGSISERAKAVLAAGSDVALLCSGNLAETESVAAAVPPLEGPSLARFRRACAVFGQQEAFDVVEAEAGLARLLRGTG